MKSQTLPVKRRPVPRGILRRLSAVTRSRKQQVAAAAVPASEIEAEDGGSRISRALTIIFLIHIVAIGLIFVHQRFLDGRPSDSPQAAKTEVAASAPATSSHREDLPRLTVGEKPYVVRPGDNYARIAASEGVDEGDLRLLNKHVDIGPGLILRIPPKRIVAVDPPELAAIREQTPSDQGRGLVEAVDVSSAPKAQLVRPSPAAESSAKTTPTAATKTAGTTSSNKNAGVLTSSKSTPVSTSSKTTQVPTSSKTTPGSASAKSNTTPAPAAANGKSYVVQPGDSIWRIASKFKTSQDSIMRANGISDARKMKTGMKLVIPQG